MNAEGPQTLIEAVKHFADLGACHAYTVKLKWPDGKIEGITELVTLVSSRAAPLLLAALKRGGEDAGALSL